MRSHNPSSAKLHVDGSLGRREQRRRQVKAESLGGYQIDDELVFGPLSRPERSPGWAPLSMRQIAMESATAAGREVTRPASANTDRIMPQTKTRGDSSPQSEGCEHYCSSCTLLHYQHRLW